MLFVHRVLSDKRLLFVFFWLIVGLIYLPSYKAGFIADFLGLFETYREGSFSDFVNRKGATATSLYQVTQLQLYLFIRLFGTHFIPWFLVITGLHALNGVVVYLFFSCLFEDFKLSRGRTIAIGGTLLFLLNPNITAVTIWKGGYHYLTGVLMQMMALIWCRKFFYTGESKYAWYSAIVFAIATYTLEIFYATPCLLLLLILGYFWKGVIEKPMMRRALICFVLPQLILLALHLVTYRLVYGGWIAHYGSTSTFTLTAAEALPRAGKYLAFLLLMAGHIPFAQRTVINEFFSNAFVYYSLILLVLAAATYAVVRFRALSPRLQVAGFILGALILCFVLIVPIYFDDLFYFYNSRRAYHPAVFIYMLVALGLFSVRNKKIAVGLFSLYMAVCLVLTVESVFAWRGAAKVQYGILRTFTWQSSDPVLLLNIPCYYKGVPIMPANEENEFNNQLKTFGYPSAQGKMYSVSSYNMQHMWDGAHVTVLDSSTLRVTLNQWGSWWMFMYAGAQSYETDLFKVDITDQGHEYLVRLKSRPPGLTALFVQDIYWRKVDMNKIGSEQW
jgi:hypothetical protein